MPAGILLFPEAHDQGVNSLGPAAVDQQPDRPGLETALLAPGVVAVELHDIGPLNATPGGAGEGLETHDLRGKDRGLLLLDQPLNNGEQILVGPGPKGLQKFLVNLVALEDIKTLAGLHPIVLAQHVAVGGPASLVEPLQHRRENLIRRIGEDRQGQQAYK